MAARVFSSERSSSPTDAAMKLTNPLKALRGICGVPRLVRRLSAWAWEEMLFDVGRVEWKYGRTDDGKPKNWTEWNNVRVHLREAGKLRQPQELDSPNPQDASPLRGCGHPTVQKYSLRKTIMKTTQNIIKLEPKTYGVGVFFSFRDVVEYSKENVYTWSMPRKYLYVLVALVFFSLSFQFPISFTKYVPFTEQ
jgi:hypothetical protein